MLEGFALNTGSELVAFANECPHWHVDLDLGIGDFLDPPTGRILCRNHGALFHPLTGVCERGPCVGLALERFELERDGDDAWVSVPDAELPPEATP
jgi:nitrite reductase/ring-hydroxylating ferredoxin subunit